MPQAAEESADADTDEERERLPWASATPHTRLAGTPRVLIYSGNLDESVAQNGTSFGVVLENPELVKGTTFANEAKPDDGTMADAVDEDSTTPTDYRFADKDDTGTDLVKGALATGEKSTVDGDRANIYEEGGLDEDEIIVWYNGMAGERIGRILDFNGLPFADWTDEGDYLVKGLIQVPPEWRDASGSERGKLKENGKGPRVARAPILRTQVEHETDDEGNIVGATLLDEPQDQRVLIDLSRFQGGRGYEVHVFDAEAFADEFGSLGAEIPRTSDGYVDDDAVAGIELDWLYDGQADDVLEEAGFRMRMHTGDGWQDEPDNWTPSSTSEVDSFGINDESSGFPTPKQRQFIEEIVEGVQGTELTPDEAFEEQGGVAGLIGKYADQFDTPPEPDQVREAVYSDDRLSHLSPEDLEE